MSSFDPEAELKETQSDFNSHIPIFLGHVPVHYAFVRIPLLKITLVFEVSYVHPPWEAEEAG